MPAAKESWSQKRGVKGALGRETTCLDFNNEDKLGARGVPSESLTAQSGMRVNRFLVKRPLVFK